MRHNFSAHGVVVNHAGAPAAWHTDGDVHIIISHNTQTVLAPRNPAGKPPPPARPRPSPPACPPPPTLLLPPLPHPIPDRVPALARLDAADAPRQSQLARGAKLRQLPYAHNTRGVGVCHCEGRTAAPGRPRRRWPGPSPRTAPARRTGRAGRRARSTAERGRASSARRPSSRGRWRACTPAPVGQGGARSLSRGGVSGSKSVRKEPLPPPPPFGCRPSRFSFVAVAAVAARAAGEGGGGKVGGGEAGG